MPTNLLPLVFFNKKGNHTIVFGVKNLEVSRI